MPITKEEIKILEDNGWEIVCESPLEFERDAQFAGGIHKMSTEEEFRHELQSIETSKYWREVINRDSENEKLRDIKELKRYVKDFLVIGVTEDTLLQFYMASCWFGRKRGNEITSLDLKKWFKEVFDEVDPS